MAKLYCIICKTPFPSQEEINAHLTSAHNKTLPPEDVKWYRREQDLRWEARSEALDRRLRKNTRRRQREWEAFVGEAHKRDVPTTEMSERLAREMIWVDRIEDDCASDDDANNADGERSGDGGEGAEDEVGIADSCSAGADGWDEESSAGESDRSDDQKQAEIMRRFVERTKQRKGQQSLRKAMAKDLPAGAAASSAGEEERDLGHEQSHG